MKVTGRKPAGEVVDCSPKQGAKFGADKALNGLHDLILKYDNPSQGYPSRTAPQFVKTYAGDYDHLARVFEWSTSGEEVDE